MRALLLGIALVALARGRALAIPANVADETSLRNAITDASVDVINFTADISVTADLPAVQRNMTINGAGRTLSATGEFRGLFVGAWTPGTATQVAVTVTIQDLTIDGATARGGAGALNAGGGAGLGGALFVANLASVTLTNVTFTGNAATRGARAGRMPRASVTVAVAWVAPALSAAPATAVVAGSEWAPMVEAPLLRARRGSRPEPDRAAAAVSPEVLTAAAVAGELRSLSMQVAAVSAEETAPDPTAAAEASAAVVGAVLPTLVAPGALAVAVVRAVAMAGSAVAAPLALLRPGWAGSAEVLERWRAVVARGSAGRCSSSRAGR